MLESSSFDTWRSEKQRMQPSHSSSQSPSTPAAGDGLFRSRSFRQAVCQFQESIHLGSSIIRFAAPPHVGGETLIQHVASWASFDSSTTIVRLPSIAVDVDVRLMALEFDELPAFLEWSKKFELIDRNFYLSPMQQLARHHQTRGCIGLLRRSLAEPVEPHYDSRSAMRASS